MTGREGYFNSRAEAMKDATQRYLGAESEILKGMASSKIESLSKLNGLTRQRGSEIMELFDKTLRANGLRFMEAFGTILYSEYGENPRVEIRRIAGNAVAKYVQLLRDQEKRVESAQSGLQITGASKQLNIDVGIITGDMAQELKKISRK
ncbi:MAG TPA: hypothetical protein VNF06_01075 [Candidatus Aquilonibacter sp.]|nr:hypothetical protein [Candidatus Aquilonibacter sp.]